MSRLYSTGVGSSRSTLQNSKGSLNNHNNHNAKPNISFGAKTLDGSSFHHDDMSIHEDDFSDSIDDFFGDDDADYPLQSTNLTSNTVRIVGREADPLDKEDWGKDFVFNNDKDSKSSKPKSQVFSAIQKQREMVVRSGAPKLVVPSVESFKDGSGKDQKDFLHNSSSLGNTVSSLGNTGSFPDSSSVHGAGMSSGISFGDDDGGVRDEGEGRDDGDAVNNAEDFDFDDMWDFDEDELEELNSHVTAPKLKLYDDDGDDEIIDDDPEFDSDFGSESEDWDAEIALEDGSSINQDGLKARFRGILCDDDEIDDDADVKFIKTSKASRSRKNKGNMRPTQALLSSLEKTPHKFDIVMYPAPPLLYSIRTVDGGKTLGEKQLEDWLTNLLRKHVSPTPPADMLQYYETNNPFRLPTSEEARQVSLLTYVNYAFKWCYLYYQANQYQAAWNIVCLVMTNIKDTLSTNRVSSHVNDHHFFTVVHNLLFLGAKLWSRTIATKYCEMIVLCKSKLFPRYARIFELLELETVAHHDGTQANSIIRRLCLTYVRAASPVPPTHTRNLSTASAVSSVSNASINSTNVMGLNPLAGHPVNPLSVNPLSVTAGSMGKGGEMDLVSMKFLRLSSPLSDYERRKQRKDGVTTQNTAPPSHNRLGGQSVTTTNTLTNSSRVSKRLFPSSTMNSTSSSNISSNSSNENQLANTKLSRYSFLPKYISDDDIRNLVALRSLTSLQLYLTAFSPLNGVPLSANAEWDEDLPEYEWIRCAWNGDRPGSSAMTINSGLGSHSNSNVTDVLLSNTSVLLNSTNPHLNMSLSETINMNLSQNITNTNTLPSSLKSQQVPTDPYSSSNLQTPSSGYVSPSKDQSSTYSHTESRNYSHMVGKGEYVGQFPTEMEDTVEEDMITMLRSTSMSTISSAEDSVTSSTTSSMQVQLQQQLLDQELREQQIRLREQRDRELGLYDEDGNPIIVLPKARSVSEQLSSIEHIVWKLCGHPEYRIRLMKKHYGECNLLCWVKANAANTLGRHEWFVDDDKMPEDHVMVAERLVFECLYILDHLPNAPLNIPIESCVDSQHQGDVNLTWLRISVTNSPLASQLALVSLQLFADVLFALNKYKYAIRALESALVNHQLRNGDSHQLIRMLSDICTSHNDIPRSIVYHLKILSQSLIDGNLDAYVFVTQEMSIMYAKQGNYRRAEEQLKTAITFLLSLSSPSSQVLGQALIEVRHAQNSSLHSVNSNSTNRFDRGENRELQQIHDRMQVVNTGVEEDMANETQAPSTTSLNPQNPTYTHSSGRMSISGGTPPSPPPSELDQKGLSVRSLQSGSLNYLINPSVTGIPGNNLNFLTAIGLSRFLEVAVVDVKSSIANLIILLAKLYMASDKLVHALVLLEALYNRDHDYKAPNAQTPNPQYVPLTPMILSSLTQQTPLFLASGHAITTQTLALPIAPMTPNPSSTIPYIGGLVNTNTNNTITSIVTPWAVLANIATSLPKAKFSIVSMLLANVYMRLSLPKKADRVLRYIQHNSFKHHREDVINPGQMYNEMANFSDDNKNGRDLVYSFEYMEARAHNSLLLRDFKNALNWIGSALSKCDDSSLHLLGKCHYSKGLIYQAILFDQMYRGINDSSNISNVTSFNSDGSSLTIGNYSTLDGRIPIIPPYKTIGSGEDTIVLPDPRLCAGAFTKAYSNFEKVDDKVKMAECLINLVETYLHIVFVSVCVLDHPFAEIMPWLRLSGFGDMSNPSDDSPDADEKLMSSFLNTIEQFNTNASNTASDVFLPLLILQGLLNFAEIRMLQGNPVAALSYWLEAANSYSAAFIVCEQVILPPKPSYDLLSEHRKLLSRIIRLLMTFDATIINAHLYLLDTYMHFDSTTFDDQVNIELQDAFEEIRAAEEVGSSGSGSGNAGIHGNNNVYTLTKINPAEQTYFQSQLQACSMSPLFGSNTSTAPSPVTIQYVKQMNVNVNCMDRLSNKDSTCQCTSCSTSNEALVVDEQNMHAIGSHLPNAGNIRESILAQPHINSSNPNLKRHHIQQEQNVASGLQTPRVSFHGNASNANAPGTPRQYNTLHSNAGSSSSNPTLHSNAGSSSSNPGTVAGGAMKKVNYNNVQIKNPNGRCGIQLLVDVNNAIVRLEELGGGGGSLSSSDHDQTVDVEGEITRLQYLHLDQAQQLHKGVVVMTSNMHSVSSSANVKTYNNVLGLVASAASVSSLPSAFPPAYQLNTESLGNASSTLNFNNVKPRENRSGSSTRPHLARPPSTPFVDRDRLGAERRERNNDHMGTDRRERNNDQAGLDRSDRSGNFERGSGSGSNLSFNMASPAPQNINNNSSSSGNAPLPHYMRPAASTSSNASVVSNTPSGTPPLSGHNNASIPALSLGNPTILFPHTPGHPDNTIRTSSSNVGTAVVHRQASHLSGVSQNTAAHKKIARAMVKGFLPVPNPSNDSSALLDTCVMFANDTLAPPNNTTTPICKNFGLYNPQACAWVQPIDAKHDNGSMHSNSSVNISAFSSGSNNDKTNKIYNGNIEVGEIVMMLSTRISVALTEMSRQADLVSSGHTTTQIVKEKNKETFSAIVNATSKFRHLALRSVPHHTVAGVGLCSCHCDVPDQCKCSCVNLDNIATSFWLATSAATSTCPSCSLSHSYDPASSPFSPIGSGASTNIVLSNKHDTIWLGPNYGSNNIVVPQQNQQVQQNVGITTPAPLPSNTTNTANNSPMLSAGSPSNPIPNPILPQSVIPNTVNFNNPNAPSSDPSTPSIIWGNPSRHKMHANQHIYIFSIGCVMYAYTPKTRKIICKAFKYTNNGLTANVSPLPSDAFIQSFLKQVYQPEQVMFYYSNDTLIPSPTFAGNSFSIGSTFDDIASSLPAPSLSFLPQNLWYTPVLLNSDKSTAADSSASNSNIDSMFVTSPNEVSKTTNTGPITTYSTFGPLRPGSPTENHSNSLTLHSFSKKEQQQPANTPSCLMCQCVPCLCNTPPCTPLLTVVTVDPCMNTNYETLRNSFHSDIIYTPTDSTKGKVVQAVPSSLFAPQSIGHAQIIQVNLRKIHNHAFQFYDRTYTDVPPFLPPPPTYQRNRTVPYPVSHDGAKVLSVPIWSEDDQTPQPAFSRSSDPQWHSPAYKLRFPAPEKDNPLVAPFIAPHLFALGTGINSPCTDDVCPCSLHNGIVNACTNNNNPNNVRDKHCPCNPHNNTDNCQCTELSWPRIRIPTLGTTYSTKFNNHIRISVADSEALLPPPIETECLYEFSKLDGQQIIQLFSALLCESRVLFVSKSTFRIKAIIDTVLSLLYPFKWQGAYVPLLHRSAGHLLYHKRAYIIGCLTSTIECIVKQKTPVKDPKARPSKNKDKDNSPSNSNLSPVLSLIASLNLGSDVVVVDIDSGVVRFTPGTFVVLPEPIRAGILRIQRTVKASIFVNVLKRGVDRNRSIHFLGDDELADKPKTNGMDNSGAGLNGLNNTVSSSSSNHDLSGSYDGFTPDATASPSTIHYPPTPMYVNNSAPNDNLTSGPFLNKISTDPFNLMHSSYSSVADPAHPSNAAVTQYRNIFLNIMLTLFGEYVLFWDACVSARPKRPGCHNAPEAIPPFMADIVGPSNQTGQSNTNNVSGTIASSGYYGVAKPTKEHVMSGPYVNAIPQPRVTVHSLSNWYNNIDYDLPGFIANTDYPYRSFVQAVTNTHMFRHFLAVRHRLRGMPVCMYLFDQWAVLKVHNKWTCEIATDKLASTANVLSVARTGGRFHKRLVELHGSRIHVYQDEERTSKFPMPKHDRLLVPLTVKAVLSPSDRAKQNKATFSFKLVACLSEDVMYWLHMQYPLMHDSTLTTLRSYLKMNAHDANTNTATGNIGGNVSGGNPNVNNNNGVVTNPEDIILQMALNNTSTHCFHGQVDSSHFDYHIFAQRNVPALLSSSLTNSPSALSFVSSPVHLKSATSYHCNYPHWFYMCDENKHESYNKALRVNNIFGPEASDIKQNLTSSQHLYTIHCIHNSIAIPDKHCYLPVFWHSPHDLTLFPSLPKDAYNVDYITNLALSNPKTNHEREIQSRHLNQFEVGGTETAWPLTLPKLLETLHQWDRGFIIKCDNHEQRIQLLKRLNAKLQDPELTKRYQQFM